MAFSAVQEKAVRTDPPDTFYRRLNGAVRNLEHVFLTQLDGAAGLEREERARIRASGCAVVATARRNLEMLAATGFCEESETVRLLREIRDAMVGTADNGTP